MSELSPAYCQALTVPCSEWLFMGAAEGVKALPSAGEGRKKELPAYNIYLVSATFLTSLMMWGLRSP